MTWRERLAAAWDHPRLREELAAAQAKLTASRAECAHLEDHCIRLEKHCEELNESGLELSSALKDTQQKMEAYRAALLSFCPTLDSTENLRQFYDCVAPQYDPEGFRLYSAAEKITGIGSLYNYFPYEDARGYFEEADGHTAASGLSGCTMPQNGCMNSRPGKVSIAGRNSRARRHWRRL